MFFSGSETLPRSLCRQLSTKSDIKPQLNWCCRDKDVSNILSALLPASWPFQALTQKVFGFHYLRLPAW